MRNFLILLIAGFLFAVAPAQAAQVAYIQDGQVWVSTLDGTKKQQLTGAVLPEGAVFREVAQADNGRILGVARVGAHTLSLNTTAMWDASGGLIYQGSLSYNNLAGTPTSSAYPVTLDLTADGVFAVFGYSNVYGFGINRTFRFGTYVQAADRVAAQPFDIEGVWNGTVAPGGRVVGVQGGRTDVTLQNPEGQPPNSYDFTPWLAMPDDVFRADVAATGTIAGAEIDEGQYDGRIAMIPFGAVGGPPPTDGTDCFLPTQGPAQYLSISQDGTMLAWQDDRGVVVAGAPVWFASAAVSDCNLSSPPVVISATGTYPSIGASTAATPPVTPGPNPNPTPTPTPGGTPTPGPGGGTAAPKVSAARKVKAKGLKTGVTVTVTVAAAGKVSAVGKVGKKTVAKGSATAKAAGKVKLKLKATKAYRKKLGKLKGKKLKVTITGPGGKVTLSRKLR